jgi:peptide deformylase
MTGQWEAPPLTGTDPSRISPTMARRDIIQLPDPLLKTVSKPVRSITEDVWRLMSDMLETMYAAPGIGLAAVQIGEPRRVVVIDLAKDDEPRNPQFFVNPEILWSSEEKSEHEEGCLSIPEVFDTILRPSAVKVGFLDREGKPRELDCEGLMAICLQHEIDHLNGILFIDHLSRLKRDRIIRKFTKAARREKADA